MNHSVSFKEQETSAHVNSIEGTWSAIKRSFPGPNKCKNSFDCYLFEYVCRRKHSDSGDLFEEFLKCARRVYNPE